MDNNKLNVYRSFLLFNFNYLQNNIFYLTININFTCNYKQYTTYLYKQLHKNKQNKIK